MAKFLRSSDVFNKDAQPNWTDTDGFYNRVHWIATEAHSASIDDNDIIDYFMLLEQLHLEIEGAITSTEDRMVLEDTRKEIRKYVYNRETINDHIAKKRERVREYHRFINYYCHKYSLFLKKTAKDTLDTWDENEQTYDKQTFKLQPNRAYTLNQP